MRSRYPNKAVFHVSLLFLLALLLALQVAPTLADSPTVQIVFDTDIQSTVTIGRTPKLLISITNPGPNPIRSTNFFCRQQSSKFTGPTLVPSSISQLPGTIAPNATFHTEQVYRAVIGGATAVQCELNAVDTVTGAAITVNSNQSQLDVLPETRLTFDATSTRVATVGQSVFIMATYNNHGPVIFSNVQVNCTEFGFNLVFISSRQNMTTLTPGQSGFVELRWQANIAGEPHILCTVSALDSSTGLTVTLPAPTLRITVK
jgi:hypothetical protein